MHTQPIEINAELIVFLCYYMTIVYLCSVHVTPPISLFYGKKHLSASICAYLCRGTRAIEKELKQCAFSQAI